MRFYRTLLHLYPHAFRAEYGEEMAAVFAQRRRQARGPLAVAALLGLAITDVVASATAVHWDIVRQDLVYAVRALRRAPMFAVTAILLAALGVGANTAAFSVADLVFIRPLPFSESDRLVKLWQHPPGYDRMELSPANYRDWKRLSTSYAAMGAYYWEAVNLVGVGDPERLEGARITPDVLSLLGVRPLIGRLFVEADGRDGAPLTVVLSHGLWQSEFGGDATIIGRRILLDGTPHVVIGVMPPTFLFPRRAARLWVPLQLREVDYADRADNILEVIARLATDVSVEQARAELAVITARLEREFPKENERVAATIYPLRDEVSSRTRLLLVALCGAAVCILLIACANLGSLLVAKSLARARELALRSALGAGRERLVRQLVTESSVLALSGGALGVLVAAGSMSLLGRLIPASLPISETPAIDGRVLAFAALLTALTGFAFGVLPALRLGRQDGMSALRDGTRTVSGHRERLRAALVVIEVMATVVLLVASGLLMRAIWRVQARDPGFRADGLLTLRTALPFPKYDSVTRRQEYYRRVLTRVEALPGVTSAAYTSFLPMTMGGGIWPVSLRGEERQRNEASSASLRFVTPGYFRTLGIPFRAGRDIAETDTKDTPSVAVVSESFARRYWPNEPPIGRRFHAAFSARTVVGVVGDIRVRGLEVPSEPQMYLPAAQVADGWLVYYAPRDLVIRTSGLPASLAGAVRAIIHEADPEQPVTDVRAMREIIVAETASRTLQLRLLGALAAVAFVLAGIGIHGLLSFSVSQRAREIGVRRALGARSRDILRMVLGQSALLAGSGVVVGVAIAYAAARTMEALLAGVRPADPPTFLAAVGLCLIMALLGSLLPALRALRVDPVTAMRAD
jgi:predicted permease